LVVLVIDNSSKWREVFRGRASEHSCTELWAAVFLRDINARVPTESEAFIYLFIYIFADFDLMI